MTDTRKNDSPVRSDAHWRADDDRNLSFTLHVKRRARAEADPWHNFGTVYGAGLFHSRKAENVVTPMKARHFFPLSRALPSCCRFRLPRPVAFHL